MQTDELAAQRDLSGRLASASASPGGAACFVEARRRT
jgi:hypothetical protein